MLYISLLFACAKENVVPKAEQPVAVQLLETIELASEFGDAAAGWQYQLKKLSVEPGVPFSLPANTGWIVMGKDAIGESGMSAKYLPLEACAQGCTLLTATVVQESNSEEGDILTEQFLSDEAPKQSTGISLSHTWTEPLVDFPLKNKALRFRSVDLTETGVVGQHKHSSRPSFAYVLSGSVIEHRGDGDVSHQSSGRVAERNGLVHWWESQSEATIVVFDIIDL